MKHQQHPVATLQRSSSCSKSTRKLIPASRSTSTIPEHEGFSDKLLVRRDSSFSSGNLQRFNKVQYKFSSLIRTVLKAFSFPSIIIPPTCKWLSVPTQLFISPSLGRKVTGTLFGNRRGHVSFAVQDDPRTEPVLLLELAMSTAMLVKEMSSGLVRIALECEKVHGSVNGQSGRSSKLFNEPMWNMYCNGRKCGYAVSRTCTDLDWHVLSTVQSVSVGAGVIPMVEDGGKVAAAAAEGELLHMRAKFERVVGSRDSEAFYMLNPDGGAGPELSIFLLRI